VLTLLEEDRIEVNFSKVTYKQMAPFVNLQPSEGLRDITTFELHRSRIPTTLFKSIVEDIDMMLVQYGPPMDHETEEATSRFLSPVSASQQTSSCGNLIRICPQIFNRLIGVFQFAFRNLPESIIEGLMTTKGRVEYYFRSIGSIAVLFVEFKLKIGSAKERLDAIGQVIAECDGQTLFFLTTRLS
jgi:hypothetical protein